MAHTSRIALAAILYYAFGMRSILRIACVFVLFVTPALAEEMMVTRVANGAYVSPAELYQWILDHPNQAQDAVFKKEVFRIANTRLPKEEMSLALSKVQALKKAGWYREWNESAFALVNQYATQMMQGDFTYEAQGRVLLEVHREADAMDPVAAARFYAPLAVMQGGLTPGEPLAVVQRLPAVPVQQAARELATALPSQAFWFSGVAWNDDQLRLLAQVMPQALQTASAECAQYRTDPTQDPLHTSATACAWLK